MRGLRAFMSSRYCFTSGRVSGTGRGVAAGSAAWAAPAVPRTRPQATTTYRRMGNLLSIVRADHHEGGGRADAEDGLLLDLLAVGRLEDQDHVASQIAADDLILG